MCTSFCEKIALCKQRTADGAARAAGTVYRMVAGTDTELQAYTGDSEAMEPLEMVAAAASSPTAATTTTAGKPPAAPAKPTVGGLASKHPPHFLFSVDAPQEPSIS